MTACPENLLLLHALVDDELDVAAAAALEAHIAGCAGCAAERRALTELTSLVQGADLGHRPPAGWASRALPAPPAASVAPRRPWPSRWIAGAAIAAMAASLALFALPALLPADLAGEVVDGQIRSLQAQHLVDVETSDRHVVKPWFNGKIDFAPPVVDLAADGFPLVGGRLDSLGGRTAAALVFRRRAHVINLFIWPGAAPATPAFARRDGYSLARWGRGGLQYWAVSDIEPADLARFQSLYATRAGG